VGCENRLLSQLILPWVVGASGSGGVLPDWTAPGVWPASLCSATKPGSDICKRVVRLVAMSLMITPLYENAPRVEPSTCAAPSESRARAGPDWWRVLSPVR